MNSFSLYADMVRYFLRPVFTRHRETLSINSGVALLGLIILVILTVIPLLLISAYLVSLAGASPLEASEEYQRFQAEASFIFMAVIFAPLVEETLFRSWLGYRRGVLLVMPALLILFACFMLPTGIESQSWVSIFRTGLMGGLGFYYYKWSQIKPSVEAQENMLRGLFPWVFWGTAFYFGMTHSGNFSGDYFILLWPVALSPLIFMGGVLGFIRMRFGVLVGMVFHGAYNGLILTISGSL